MEQLKKYLETESAARLASRIGMSRSQVWRLAKGEVEPKVSTALKIAAATGNAVPVEAWFAP